MRSRKTRLLQWGQTRPSRILRSSSGRLNSAVSIFGPDGDRGISGSKLLLGLGIEVFAGVSFGEISDGVIEVGAGAAAIDAGDLPAESRLALNEVIALSLASRAMLLALLIEWVLISWGWFIHGAASLRANSSTRIISTRPM